MGGPEATRTAARPGGSVLLAAGAEPWRSSSAYVADGESAADALLGVVVDRNHDAFLADWRDWVDPARDLAVLDVGCEARSVAEAAEAPSRAVARAVSADDLEELPVMVRTYLEEWAEADRRAVLYLEGVAGLVRAVGLPRLVTLLDELLEQVEATDARCYVAASTARPDAAAVLAPLFDDVLDVDGTEDGGYRAIRRERPALPVDRLFELLQPERRRRTLQYVARVDATSVDELASYLASADRPDGAAGDDAQQRIRIGLYQFDLPKLHDAGVVDFDPDAGTVEARERLDALRPYLALAAHHGAPE